MPSRFLFARAGTKRAPAPAGHEDGEASEAVGVASRAPSSPAGVTAKPRQGTALTGVFGTETVAELCVRQGRPAEAVAIFERLLARKPDDPRASRWQQRLHELGGAAAAGLESARPAGPASEAPSETAALPGTTALRETAALSKTPALPETVAPPGASEFAAGATGLVAGPSPPPTVAVTPAATAEPRWSPALVVREPVRSGQVVYAEGRDLVVLAPVSSGAELIADGHVHVYAPLRGRAVAGARGAADAFIFCQRLEAELVGIDDAHLTAEDLAAAWRGRAVQIQLLDGALRVTPLGAVLTAGSATDRG